MVFKMTKKQIKDQARISAWLEGRTFKENAKAKPEVPILADVDILDTYVPAEVTECGKHYTPRDMALELISYISPSHFLRILEPCAGIGHLIWGLTQDPAISEYQITAYEPCQADLEIGQKLFPGANWICETPFNELACNLEHDIDTITSQYDLVVMNPPINITWYMSPAEQMSQSKAKKSEHLFLELAVRACKPGGKILALAPYNYIDKMPKVLKTWFDSYIVCVTDLGEMNGEFLTTGVRLHGWMIDRNQIPIQEPISIEVEITKDWTLVTEIQPEEESEANGLSQTSEPAPLEVKQDTLFDISQTHLVFQGDRSLSLLRESFDPSMTFPLRPTKEFIESIATSGVLQPILVELKDSKYIIRSGKRRFLAAEACHMETIPCRIVSYPLGMGAKAGLDSNLQRSRSPVDEYHMLLELEDALSSQGQVVTDSLLASQLGVNIQTVKKLRKIERLPQIVQDAIGERKISINNAYEIAKLPKVRQAPLVEKLETGKKITWDDVKSQKRVRREEETATLIPLFEMPEMKDSRPDVPSKARLVEAVEAYFGDLYPPVTQETRDRIVEFCWLQIQQKY